MKNYVQPGDTITFAAPYARSSGEAALLTAVFGVAVADVANGAEGEWVTVGVFDITALTTDTPAVGAKLYWDDTNKRLTTTSAGNTYVGTCLKAKANGETTARCRLNGLVP